MIYPLDILTRKVRTAIDRNSPEPLLPHHHPDILDLDHIIRSKLPMAARYVYEKAPIEVLAESALDLADDDIFWHEAVDGMYSGHLLLPRNFLRLLVFEMSDWRHPVFEAFTLQSPHFSIQDSPYAGVRGTPYRPVCLLMPSAEGPSLEFYSCSTDTEHIAQAKYISVPEVDADGGLDLTPRSLDQTVNLAAVITLTTIGEYDKAQQLLNLNKYL